MRDLTVVYKRDYTLGPIGVPEVGDEFDVPTEHGDVRVVVTRITSDLLGRARSVGEFMDEDGELRLPVPTEAHSATCRRLLGQLAPHERRTVEGLARRNRERARLEPLAS